MSPETRTEIRLELTLDGDGLSGRAVGAAGEAREFSGRLGLMHAIDDLLAHPASADDSALASGDGAGKE
ncbi:MAG TPA: hypothetical protein VK889_09785 [Solirubrobacterales bacterium]|nr:hypothetical protein [Solirubrobacterales bacterium]